MCRPSDEKFSPSSLPGRKSSFADSSITSSIRSSSSLSIKKRVSFDTTIKVYPLERLSNEQISEVFYCPQDYRRFRSDTCLEMLDQQQQPPYKNLKNLCHKFMIYLAANKKSRQQKAMDLPWLTPYHPQESLSEEISPLPCVTKATTTGEDRERLGRIIEELAFLP